MAEVTANATGGVPVTNEDEFIQKFFQHVDDNTKLYIDRLAEAVA